MYDRLTNHWHLNNLLWVWGPFNPVDAQYYDAPHVDIGGFDLYTGNQSDDGWLTQNNALKAAV